eukprot:Skav212285  [mRNA]  locus=scaffold732:410399:411904:- [translate_table: standard]
MATNEGADGGNMTQPGSSWNSFRILSEGMGMVPVRSQMETSTFQEAMSEATLPLLEAAVMGLCASLEPGCVMALCHAARHRWGHLPKEERRSLLLTLRQLRYLQASVPALVAGALSVGTAPVLGTAAGLERRQVEAAFGQGVATLLVELQQFLAIERTLRSSGTLSPGKVDLAMSLFTAQKTQSRSTESLIVFLANKAAELRLLSLKGVDGDATHRAVLGTDVFAALANLLGLGRIKDELEDAAFEILHPQERHELRQLLGGPEGEALVNSAVGELQEALSQGERLKDLSALRVSGRAKSAYSTWKKMKKKKLRFDEVLDRAAIRVILDAPSAKRAEELCFEVRNILAEMWSIRSRSKDYINNPKPNGYRSLHLVAERDGQPFEVQIRTEEMHRQAEYGSCGHWEYKAGGPIATSKAAEGAGAEIFAGLDVDGDGRIDKLELQRALRQVGVEASLEEVSDMMEVFDSDGDGSVDFGEFWQALVTTWFPLVSGTHRPKRRAR